MKTYRITTNNGDSFIIEEYNIYFVTDHLNQIGFDPENIISIILEN